MNTQDYISYIKELILHHCLRCGDLSETTTCDVCKREINGEPVMVKVEVRITASSVDAHVADVYGDFGQIIHPKGIEFSKSHDAYHHGNLSGYKRIRLSQVNSPSEEYG